MLRPFTCGIVGVRPVSEQSSNQRVLAQQNSIAEWCPACGIPLQDSLELVIMQKTGHCEAIWVFPRPSCVKVRLQAFGRSEANKTLQVMVLKIQQKTISVNISAFKKGVKFHMKHLSNYLTNCCPVILQAEMSSTWRFAQAVCSKHQSWMRCGLDVDHETIITSKMSSHLLQATPPPCFPSATTQVSSISLQGRTQDHEKKKTWSHRMQCSEWLLFASLQPLWSCLVDRRSSHTKHKETQSQMTLDTVLGQSWPLRLDEGMPGIYHWLDSSALPAKQQTVGTQDLDAHYGPIGEKQTWLSPRCHQTPPAPQLSSNPHVLGSVSLPRVSPKALSSSEKFGHLQAQQVAHAA